MVVGEDSVQELFPSLMEIKDMIESEDKANNNLGELFLETWLKFEHLDDTDRLTAVEKELAC